MAKQGTVAYVVVLPDCDFCKALNPDRPPRKAQYDFKTLKGPWGYGCVHHWRIHRMYETLGTGLGQKLEIRSC